MKMFNLKTPLATLVTLCAAFSAAQAQADAGYGSSAAQAGAHITVGVTAASERQGHSSPGGEPGIGYSGMRGGMKVSFAGLQGPNRAVPNDNGVSVITSVPQSHGNMGSFNFAKIADADIYYGEWVSGTDFSDDSHMAYYAGKDITAAMPSEGTAQYSIKGLSGYSSGEQISGTFSTDFDANTFTGSLSSTGLSYSLSGSVSGSAFDGTASVSTTGTDTTTVNGITNGHFFGDNAQQVAGYAEFSSDKAKNIAFGGTKS
ncbi:Slam-dependent surface lipoprotein [Morganella morganii]|uniref:Slam-dependent surface lipoprotein n=1 Tax=Morganella morganii TaxID=582 RepID=UPI001C46A069|nr:Slam-dependent surface lipoprotein [Morganella morganii]QXO65415.1 transferrin-binding protein-like solute binding protein [Morganella morganii]